MDPFLTLEIPFDADDEIIRKSYLNKVKQFPPDTFPAEFKLVQEAYSLVQNQKLRAHYTVFDTTPPITSPLRALTAFTKANKQKRRPPSFSRFMKILKTHV